MSRPRQLYSEPGSPPKSMKYRESESMACWSEYLNTKELASPSTSDSWKNNSGIDIGAGLGGRRTGILQLESVIQLSRVAEGLLTKMYRLLNILDFSNLVSHTFSENFWKAGIIPNFLKICVLVSKKFPEHHGKLQLERVDKVGIDAMHENGEGYFLNLEPWVMYCYHAIAASKFFDPSYLYGSLLFLRPSKSFFLKIPRKMILQVYNILHNMLKGGRYCEFYHRLVQFVDSYDSPVQGLQEDLIFVSSGVGGCGPIIFLSRDTKKLRKEDFLSLFHPR